MHIRFKTLRCFKYLSCSRTLCSPLYCLYLSSTPKHSTAWSVALDVALFVPSTEPPGSARPNDHLRPPLPKLN